MGFIIISYLRNEIVVIFGFNRSIYTFLSCADGHPIESGRGILDFFYLKSLDQFTVLSKEPKHDRRNPKPAL